MEWDTGLDRGDARSSRIVAGVHSGIYNILFECLIYTMPGPPPRLAAWPRRKAAPAVAAGGRLSIDRCIRRGRRTE